MRKVLLAPAAALFATAAPIGVHAQDEESRAIADTPHITITATASIDVVPDLAMISLGVTKSAPTAKAAVDALAPRA